MRTSVIVLLALAVCGSAHCGGEPDTRAAFGVPSVTLSRAEAPIGGPLEITYRFAVAADAPALTSDYLVFVHFLDSSDEQIWTDDHQPPVPVRQWKPGQTIEYTRTLFVPKFPYTGTVRVRLGLYDPGSGDRLLLSAADAGLRAYDVASFTMTAAAESHFVVFRDGWHEAEAAADGGLEWQWSMREGTITFRNPGRDAELYLQVDQAVGALPEPQQVEVRLGGTVADRFMLPPGARELRRIPLPASLLGSTDTVEMTIAVDKTFVPAEVPALRSADSRELGIRVFRAYVEPK